MSNKISQLKMSNISAICYKDDKETNAMSKGNNKGKGNNGQFPNGRKILDIFGRKMTRVSGIPVVSLSKLRPNSSCNVSCTELVAELKKGRYQGKRRVV